MGGYRSGRYGSRGVIESLKRLDVREWSRQGWLTNERIGVYSWQRDGKPGGAVAYQVLGDELTLYYGITDQDGIEHPSELMIYLRRVPCRFGGERVYWQCASWDRRCDLIVMETRHCRAGCGRCLKLRY